MVTTTSVVYKNRINPSPASSSGPVPANAHSLENPLQVFRPHGAIYGFQPVGVAYVDTVKNPEPANLCLCVSVPLPKPYPVGAVDVVVINVVASTSAGGLFDVVTSTSATGAGCLLGVAVTVMVLCTTSVTVT